MKKKIFLEIIALVVLTCFSMTACQEPKPELPALTGTVNISGVAEVGQTLTANTSSLGGSGTISYLWKRGIFYIGTDNNTYTVQPTDDGSTITVTVIRSDCTGSKTSDLVGPVTNTSLSALTGTVNISGIAEVGQILTANTDSLSGNGTISYLWKRGIFYIGTDSNTYTVQLTDVGSTITVTVTRSDCSGSKTSELVGPVTNTNLSVLTGTVNISGIAEVGQILTANTDSLGGNGMISYLWKRGIFNIGTDSNTYTVQSTDAGSTITVTVTRSDYTGSKTSEPIGPITDSSLPALTGTVSIGGTAEVGQTLTANIGSLNGVGVYFYQWKSGDTVTAVNTNIIDANQQTYTLAQTDMGKYIAVTVTRSGNSGSVTSTAIGPTTEMSPEETVTVPGVDLDTKLAWLRTNVQSNAAYLVTVDKTEYLSGITSSNDNSNNYLSYAGKGNITIRLEGIGGEQIVRLDHNKGSLFIVGRGVKLVLETDITLQGRRENNTSLIYINANGAMEMRNGAKISGNTASNDTVSYGGGVYVNVGGTLTMNGGEISGNTASAPISSYSSYGGGVYVNSNGTFTMSGGIISGNTSSAFSSSYGGGVYVNSNGTFTMSGGIISGNTSSAASSSSSSYGGGVYVNSNGTFTKTGGTVYGYTADDSNSNVVRQNNRGHAAYVSSSPVKRRESTAGPTDNMDSDVEGTAGGWEE